MTLLLSCNKDESPTKKTTQYFINGIELNKSSYDVEIDLFENAVSMRNETNCNQVTACLVAYTITHYPDGTSSGIQYKTAAITTSPNFCTGGHYVIEGNGEVIAVPNTGTGVFMYNNNQYPLFNTFLSMIQSDCTSMSIGCFTCQNQ